MGTTLTGLPTLTSYWVTPTLWGSFSANGNEFRTKQEADDFVEQQHTQEAVTAIRTVYETISTPHFKPNEVVTHDLFISIKKNIGKIAELSVIKSSDLLPSNYLEYVLKFIPKVREILIMSDAQKAMNNQFRILSQYYFLYQNKLPSKNDL